MGFGDDDDDDDDDDGTAVRKSQIATLWIAGRSIMQLPTRKRKEQRTMDARGGVSATTNASIRKDVPLRSSISLFDDRAPKVLRLRQTSLAYTFLPDLPG
ncbi:unnamed protein product [Lasius platythorax]|uniref:Uncharacterized protein n=1 Tax=Lasius platythorax TaxID=488582 RepID=A0AAV2PAA1_9HYME